MPPSRLATAARTGAAGAAIGSLPGIAFLVLTMLSDASDPEWGKGAAVIGCLVLLAGFGGAGLIAGLIVGYFSMHHAPSSGQNHYGKHLSFGREGR